MIFACFSTNISLADLNDQVTGLIKSPDVSKYVRLNDGDPISKAIKAAVELFSTPAAKTIVLIAVGVLAFCFFFGRITSALLIMSLLGGGAIAGGPMISQILGKINPNLANIIPHGQEQNTSQNGAQPNAQGLPGT